MKQPIMSRSPAHGTICLSMRNIHMSYETRKALNGVDFDLYSGEIHALVGEHRAGKSSLVKILSGAAKISSGEIIYQGKKINTFTPSSAIKLGIGIVYQDLTIIPNINAIENIFTGQMIQTGFFTLHHSVMQKKTKELFERLEYEIDYTIPLYKLTPAQQHMVEFARALMIDPKIIILDELSNKLTPTEMKKIYKAILEYKNRGTGIIYISHDMDEILKLADRVTILKEGYRRGTEQVKNLDKYRLFQLTYSYMIDREQFDRNESKFVVLKHYLENIIHNLPVGIIILDINRRVRLLNYAAMEILSIENDKIAGKDIGSVLDETNFPDKNQVLEKISTQEAFTWDDIELHEDNIIKLSLTPLLDDECTPLGSILLMEDKLLDSFLDNYVIQREKMASVAEVAVGVAHEINNPLFIIKNYLQLITEKNTDADISSKLVKIEKELNRIVEIISSLLSFSRMKEIPGHTVDINSIIEEVTLLLQHNLLEKNIHLKKKLGGNPLVIRGNENKLKQVFMNILMNSIESVLDNGRISVTVSGKPGDDLAEITISDNGYGIPEETKDNIFNPFFSTKVGKSNTGLGLSICQHIIREHEGNIDFKSEPGGTTEFLIRLPLQDRKGSED